MAFWTVPESPNVQLNELPKILDQAITRTAHGDGVSVSLSFIPSPEDNTKIVQLTALHIQLKTPERAQQLVTMLQRALNTMDPDVSPDWAIQIMDRIMGIPSVGKIVQQPQIQQGQDFPLGKASTINDPDCEACQ